MLAIQKAVLHSPPPTGQQLSSCLPTESGGNSLSDHISCNMANPSRVPAGRLSVLANSLSSRHQIIGTEWSLHPSIVLQMFSIWCIPELDLLATRHNNKLAAFVSPVPDPWAVAVDALSIPCAYTPTTLMQRVFHKLVHSDQC